MFNKKFIIICFLLVFTICNPVFARRSARDKACFSNIRVIQGAVEMYNMDVSTMMEELNPKTLDILVKEKYLKSLPNPTEPGKCEYKSIGNLTDEGIIYCKYHGDLEYIIECEYYKDNDYDQYEKLSQNATNEDIKANRERIIKERKKTIERVNFKNNLYDKLKIVFIVFVIGIFIWLCIPNRKKKK